MEKTDNNFKGAREVHVGNTTYQFSKELKNLIIYQIIETRHIFNEHKKEPKKNRQDKIEKTQKEKQELEKKKMVNKTFQVKKNLEIKTDKTGTIIISIELFESIEEQQISKISITPIEDKIEVKYSDNVNIEGYTIHNNGSKKEKKLWHNSGEIKVPIIEEQIVASKFIDEEGKKHKILRAYNEYIIINSFPKAEIETINREVLRNQEVFMLMKKQNY